MPGTLKIEFCQGRLLRPDASMLDAATPLNTLKLMQKPSGLVLRNLASLASNTSQVPIPKCLAVSLVGHYANGMRALAQLATSKHMLIFQNMNQHKTKRKVLVIGPCDHSEVFLMHN